MKIFFLTLLLFLLLPITHALEIDEKLTVRIIKTSESRKTLMVNRGTEDGLVEGDHAKFVVTSGVVARAVCVRVSPSRSVWSVYRLVNADLVADDAVMSIKITPPVKITQDESRSIVQEDTPRSSGIDGVAELGIPLAEGAMDLNESKVDDLDDLRSLESEEPSIIPEKNVELFGFVNISALNSKTETSTRELSYKSSQSYHHIGLGGEYYPQKEKDWFSKFSLFGSINLMRINNQAYNGSSSTNDITEFSFGTNWHFSKLPSVTRAFIPFIHLSFAIGSTKSTYSSGAESTGPVGDFSGSGPTQGYSIGFGYKYFLANGLGVRVLADYYVRNEKYKEDEVGDRFNKTVSGPRLMIGLGYRF